MPSVENTEGANNGQLEEHRRPQGRRIGWTDGDKLWLDGETAYAVTQAFAREQGATIEISKTTLWKRVHEKGLLTDVTMENNKIRKLAVRLRFGGQLTPVYALSAYVFESEKLTI